MSEFSESYHLKSNCTDDGVALLKRAKLQGFVFPSTGGWVTVLPDAFGTKSGVSRKPSPREKATLANVGYRGNKGVHVMPDCYDFRSMCPGHSRKTIDYIGFYWFGAPAGSRTQLTIPTS